MSVTLQEIRDLLGMKADVSQNGDDLLVGRVALAPVEGKGLGLVVAYRGEGAFPYRFPAYVALNPGAIQDLVVEAGEAIIDLKWVRKERYPVVDGNPKWNYYKTAPDYLEELGLWRYAKSQKNSK